MFNIDYNYKKLLDSIAKPPIQVILSKYITDEFSIFLLPAENGMEQETYGMNPKCAKKIMALYPNLKYYIKNIELLEE